MNYLKNTENTIATADLANNQKRYLVIIGTEAKYVDRRSIIRSTYFDVHDNLVPVADFDHVEYAFLVHGGSPKSNTPERRAFETEKMEYNDIFMLPNDQTFNPGTAFHWINSTIRSKPFDYLIIQDVHSFIHVDKLIKDLDDTTKTLDQLGNDEKGLVISWNRYQELLIHPADASTANTVANVKQVWKNSVESTNVNNIIITNVYQDQDFLDLVSLYQLQPIISKTSTAKSIAVVTSSYIYDYCMEPSGTKASLNKRSYADKHGYAFVARSREFAQQAMRPDQRRTVWGKIDVIQKVLPKYDWIFWLDMDAVVMNSEQTIEDLFQRVKINDQTHFIIVRPGTDKMINAGVFLIRNTPWSFQFLDEIQNQTEWYRQGPSYEQGAMWDVMRREEFIQHTKFLDRENHLFNTFPKFYQQDDFIVHFAPDKCPNSATLKGLAAADSIKKGHVVTSQDLL